MKYLLILLVLLNPEVRGQNPGPKLVAMGSGGSAVGSIWAMQQNPSGIAGLNRAKLAIAYERHFLDTEISSQTALFVVPTRYGVFGSSLDRYGINEYNEQKIGLFYARSFGDSFKLAAGAKYNQLTSSQYGSARAYSIEVGFQVKLNSYITIGSHISNPNRSHYSVNSNSSLPVKVSFGASSQFNDKISIIIDVQMILNEQFDTMVGMEYNIIEWFSLRGGLSANPFKQYSGFGLNYKKIQCDVAVAAHPNLGYSPQIAIGYEF